MSENKMKYFEVTETTVVRANNKADAWKIARGRRGVLGQVVGTPTVNTTRLSATEARESAS